MGWTQFCKLGVMTHGQPDGWKYERVEVTAEVLQMRTSGVVRSTGVVRSMGIFSIRGPSLSSVMVTVGGRPTLEKPQLSGSGGLTVSPGRWSPARSPIWLFLSCDLQPHLGHLG